MTAQQAYAGNVTDTTGQAILGATLTLREGKDHPVKYFAITDAAGKYRLPVPYFPDSLWLTVAHLNYDDHSRWLRPADSLFTVVLRERAYDLPTLTVKQEAVVRKGDTLVFDVNQLRRAGDESVEQLLRHIPGITIEADGTILYQDLEISKFYIEGLDLLEGRYALATRNLRPGVIRDVEILEHHQPILALDSLVRPPNAAINLRLKSSIAITGNVRAGIGGEPLLHLAEGTLFGFGKRRQFSLLGSANNFGNATGSNFKNLYDAKTFRLPLVRPTKALRPTEIKPANYLANNETTGGFNFLQKIGRHAQIKWNGFATRDRVRERGGNELTYQSATATFDIKEVLNATSTPLKANNSLALEINKKKFYFLTKLEGQLASERTTGANFFNGTASPEDFRHDELDLKGRITAVVRKGNKAHQLKGDVRYLDESYDLRVSPLLIIAPDLPSQRTDTGRQVARQRKASSDLYTDRFYRRKQIRGETRLGLRSEHTLLTSTLTDGAFGLGIAFRNDIAQTLIAPYVNQQYQHENKRRRWQLKLPFSAHFTQFTDRTTEYNFAKTVVVTAPEINFTKQFAHQRALSFSYTFALDYNQEEALFTGYILRQNRFLNRQLPDLNRTRKHEISSHFRGQNKKGLVAYNTRLRLETLSADYLIQAVFDTTGEASAPLRRNNTRRTLRCDNRLTLTLLAGITANVELNYAATLLPLALNGERTQVLLHQATLSPNFVRTFSRSALSFRPELLYSTNALVNNSAVRLSLRLRYFCRLPGAWGNLKATFVRYGTFIAEREVSNILVNLRYQRPVFDGKYEISLSLNNLTNAKNFVDFSRQSYAEQLRFYRLRNRQVLLTFGRKI